MVIGLLNTRHGVTEAAVTSDNFRWLPPSGGTKKTRCALAGRLARKHDLRVRAPGRDFW